MLLFSLMFAGGTQDAQAKKKKDSEGVLIEFIILDQETEAPIPTATVRYPGDVESSRVNEISGVWQASEIYLSQGKTVVFRPGETIQMEISAPGYVTQIVKYDIRKRRNKVPVALEKMEIDDSDLDMPSIPFGRDKERQPSTGGAAN